MLPAFNFRDHNNGSKIGELDFDKSVAGQEITLIPTNRKIRKLQKKLTLMLDTVTSGFNIAVETVEDKYAYFKDAIEKQSVKVNEFNEQLDEIYSQFEEIFSKVTTDNNKKIKSFSVRIFKNNPFFEKLTKMRIEKLKKIIEDIKSNI